MHRPTPSQTLPAALLARRSLKRQPLCPRVRALPRLVGGGASRLGGEKLAPRTPELTDEVDAAWADAGAGAAFDAACERSILPARLDGFEQAVRQ